MRIKGDVLQGFSLIKSRGIPEYHVGFDVCPLCMPNAFFCCGNYRLESLIIENLIEGCDWRVDTSSEESMVYWAEKILYAVDKHLIPLFDKCTNSKSSLHELIKLVEMIEDIRLEFLRKKGWPNCDTMSTEEHCYWNDRLYYMAIKSGNWEFAQSSLLYRIKHYENQLSDINKEVSQQPQVVKEGFVEAISQLSGHLNRIKIRDHIFFDNLIQDNERQNFEHISALCPKLINNK